MIRLEIKSNLSVPNTMAKIKSYFGKGGLGLDVVEESENCLKFSGGGGFISADICESEKGSKVEFTSQEWEQQVKKFAPSLN